jgi:hypothetical protein
MPSKLFERRQARKSKRSAGEAGFYTDRDLDVKELDVEDTRLPETRRSVEASRRIADARRKRAEVGGAGNPFKQWTATALVAVSETLTGLEEYGTDKAVQTAVAQIAEELRTRPLPPPAAVTPVTARKKKADGISVDITDGNVHIDVADTSSLDAPLPMIDPVVDATITPVDIDPLADTVVDDTTDLSGGEDLDFPKADWSNEVETDITKLSYASWVAKKKK